MAYYEDGTYYFNPEVDSDDAEELEKANRMESAFRYKQAKSLQINEANLSKTLMDEALTEAGISQEDYTRLFYENQDEAKDLLSQGMKNMAHGLASKKGKKPHQPRQGQEGKPAQPEDIASKVEVLEKANKKLNSGSNLTLEDELDIVDAIVGRL